jgi:4-aminobutyrate aminotransferase-like enzyme
MPKHLAVSSLSYLKNEVANAEVSATDRIYYPVSHRKMVAGRGVYLFDEKGNRYLDAAAGTFNLSLGYSHPAVVAAIKEQAERLIHVTSSFQSDPINDLTRKLIEVAPGNMSKVHPKVSSGSAANEGAIKMAQYATGRREVITLFRSHHGQTVMTTGASGNAFRRAPFPGGNRHALQVPDPYCFRCFYGQRQSTCGLMCVSRIEDFMEYASDGQVAAVMVEPISGNGGNVVAPDGYLLKLREFCNERDIVLIFDEIQTGIGRTGQMFAAQHFGVEPDAITVAKGLGGSGAQVAAILTNDRLAGLPAHHHSFTYGANLLAAAAAVATIDIVRKPAFLAHVRAVGKYVLERLADLGRRFAAIADVRGVGLMIGFELANPDGTPAVDLANHLAETAMDHGLILRTSRYGRGNVIKIRPALNITMEEAQDLCDRLEKLFAIEVGA